MKLRWFGMLVLWPLTSGAVAGIKCTAKKCYGATPGPPVEVKHFIKNRSGKLVEVNADGSPLDDDSQGPDYTRDLRDIFQPPDGSPGPDFPLLEEALFSSGIFHTEICEPSNIRPTCSPGLLRASPLDPIQFQADARECVNQSMALVTLTLLDSKIQACLKAKSLRKVTLRLLVTDPNLAARARAAAPVAEFADGALSMNIFSYHPAADGKRCDFPIAAAMQKICPSSAPPPAARPAPVAPRPVSSGRATENLTAPARTTGHGTSSPVDPLGDAPSGSGW